MKPNGPGTSFTHYFFIFLLVCGGGLLAASFFTGTSGGSFSGIRQIGVGAMLTGIGEWINHPLQRSIAYKHTDQIIFHTIKHRKRNPSTLGNLCEIAGLLLLFTGLADFL